MLSLELLFWSGVITWIGIRLALWLSVVMETQYMKHNKVVPINKYSKGKPPVVPRRPGGVVREVIPLKKKTETGAHIPMDGSVFDFGDSVEKEDIPW